MQEPFREINSFIGPDTAEQIAAPATRPALSAQGLQLAGLSDAGQGYRMHRPCPAQGHLLVTLGGVGRVWVGGQWVECAEGSAYISPPGVACAFETLPSRRWRFGWVFTRNSGSASDIAFSFAASTLAPADPRPLTTAIEGLYREGIGLADRSLLDDWAHLIRAYTQRIVQSHPVHRFDPLAPLWAEVDARPAADWSLTRLTERACMSTETLRQRCLTHHGRSPIEQVTHLRMRRADTLLQSTSSKLIVIARMVGYENVSAFSTAFRRTYGVPPSSRRQIRD